MFCMLGHFYVESSRGLGFSLLSGVLRLDQRTHLELQEK